MFYLANNYLASIRSSEIYMSGNYFKIFVFWLNKGENNFYKSCLIKNVSI